MRQETAGGDAEPRHPGLDELVAIVRGNPAMGQKASIAMVRDAFGAGDWLSGPGDDGAVVDAGGTGVVLCGEAVFPPFVERDPYGAGVAAVLTNVNDIAAMGGVPLAIVDTVTGDDAHCRAMLDGMRYASDLYRVPVVGGHLSVTAGPPSLSAFAMGTCPTPLSATAARPGHHLALLACLEGRMRDDFAFFRSFDERGRQLADDIRFLSFLAGAGICKAAKDVSMAGLIGSLAMLLEPSGCGVTIDVDAIAHPAGVTLERWLVCFPCYAFLVCLPAGQVGPCRSATTAQGLTLAPLGALDGSGHIRLRDGDHQATVFDVGVEDITGLRPR